MNRQEFLSELQKILQREEPLNENLMLSDIEEWDSLATLMTVSMIKNKCGVETNVQEIKEMSSVIDILKKVKL